MADLNDQTLNVNIASDDNTKLVTVTTDGSKNRLDVDARITPVFGTPVHAYNYDSDADVGDVLASHTVSTGKIMYIYGWGTSSDSTGWFRLEIAGTAVDATINDDSGSGQRGLNSVNYTFPLVATAGQVVRIYKWGGLSNKDVCSFIIGTEVDA